MAAATDRFVDESPAPRRQRSNTKGHLVWKSAPMGGICDWARHVALMINRVAGGPGSGTVTPTAAPWCKDASSAVKISRLPPPSDILPEHHGDAVRHVLDDRQIGADEEQRRCRTCCNLQHVDDLRLTRNASAETASSQTIKFGLRRRVPGDADALALTA